MKNIVEQKKMCGRNAEERVKDFILSKFRSGNTPILIAVGGPGGTGKSSFSRRLVEVLDNASVLHLDDYKTSRHFRRKKRIMGPHPEANEMGLLRGHLESVKAGIPFFKPVYDRSLGMAKVTELYEPSLYNVIDGEISTYEHFKDLIDVSIYIDSRKRTQLKTRITRDVQERGYSFAKAVNTFWRSNIKEFFKYGYSSRKWADIILFCDKEYKLTFNRANN